MRVRSFDELDLQLAWRRVLAWARGGSSDVPDRMPFEVIERLFPGGVRLDVDHHLREVMLVMASKRSGTFRPFVRLSPTDLLLYQALVDGLAPSIERALADRTRVMAYRQTLEASENPFDGSPSFSQFNASVQRLLETQTTGFALKTDIAGYFMHVDPDELERQLLEACDRPLVARDLGDLLRHYWSLLGVRGLPQGLRPSSPLGNLFLKPLDDLLDGLGVPYVRYMDDLWVATQSYADARGILDAIERRLYEMGLTLGSDKTRTRRWDRALLDAEAAGERLARRKRAMLEGLDEMRTSDYVDADDLPDPERVELAAVVAEYDSLLDRIDEDQLPRGFQSTLIEILRDLEAVNHAHRVTELPHVLLRAPDLTSQALRYVASVADADVKAAMSVFVAMLASDRFLRDFEKLSICHAALLLPRTTSKDLVTSFGRLACEDAHELVRARGLLAWGAHSSDHDFSIADAFWSSARPEWQAYPIVAIQGKEAVERDSRYAAWSAEGRFHGLLADKLKAEQIAWRKL